MWQVDFFQRELHSYVYSDGTRAAEAAAPEVFKMGRPVPKVSIFACHLWAPSILLYDSTRIR
jgi:hypothetical protein